jgi:hypothetical protein
MCLAAAAAAAPAVPGCMPPCFCRQPQVRVIHKSNQSLHNCTKFCSSMACSFNSRGCTRSTPASHDHMCAFCHQASCDLLACRMVVWCYLKGFHPLVVRTFCIKQAVDAAGDEETRVLQPCCCGIYSSTEAPLHAEPAAPLGHDTPMPAFAPVTMQYCLFIVDFRPLNAQKATGPQGTTA